MEFHSPPKRHTIDLSNSEGVDLRGDRGVSALSGTGGRKQRCQKVPCKVPKERSNQQFYGGIMPMNHNNKQPGTITLT